MVKAAIPADGATGRYETLLRAGARAAAKTGVPLMMHTESGKKAVEAVRICLEAGMKPEKIVVCHVDRQAADFAPHDAVAELGVYLDYDTVGRFKYHSDAQELELLKHMMPYAEKILLALDTTAARLGAYNGEISLNYIFDSFIPALREAGFSEETIRGYVNGNCRRLFAGA
jgi:phosphotriesterase-related protein